MKHTILLGLAVAVLAMPAAAAQDDESYQPSMESMVSEVEGLGQLTVSVQSKAIAFSWEGIEIGPNMSSWVRHTFDDTFGDRDGNVSIEEMENGEDILAAWIQGEFDKYAHQEGSGGFFMIDNTNPKTAAVTSLDTVGIVGPVESDEGISLSFTVVVEFPTFDKNVHTVKLDMGQYYFHTLNESQVGEIAGDFSLTIAGGGGWTIDGASIQPQCAADNWDEGSGSIVFDAADVNCFTGHSGVLLAFSITGEESDFLGVPGFELPLMLLSIFGGAFALRRRQ